MAVMFEKRFEIKLYFEVELLTSRYCSRNDLKASPSKKSYFVRYILAEFFDLFLKYLAFSCRV